MSTLALASADRFDSDLLCFTALRWHCMPRDYQFGLRRAARARRIFVVEEPVFVPGAAEMDVEYPDENLTVARPCLPYALADSCVRRQQQALLDAWMDANALRPDILWYQVAVAFGYTAHLRARLTIYDCLDWGAEWTARPGEFRRLEEELMQSADIVFAESERARHALATVHPAVRRAAPGGALPQLDALADGMLAPVSHGRAASGPFVSRNGGARQVSTTTGVRADAAFATVHVALDWPSSAESAATQTHAAAVGHAQRADAPVARHRWETPRLERMQGE